MNKYLKRIINFSKDTITGNNIGADFLKFTWMNILLLKKTLFLVTHHPPHNIKKLSSKQFFLFISKNEIEFVRQYLYISNC